MCELFGMSARSPSAVNDTVLLATEPLTGEAWMALPRGSIHVFAMGRRASRTPGRRALREASNSVG